MAVDIPTVVITCDDCGQSETVELNVRFNSYSASSMFYDLASVLEGMENNDGWTFDGPLGDSESICGECNGEEEDED